MLGTAVAFCYALYICTISFNILRYVHLFNLNAIWILIPISFQPYNFRLSLGEIDLPSSFIKWTFLVQLSISDNGKGTFFRKLEQMAKKHTLIMVWGLFLFLENCYTRGEPCIPSTKWIGKKKYGWIEVINQSEVKITDEDVKSRQRKLANWKALGKDGIHSYSLRSLTNLHPQLRIYLQKTMDQWIKEYLTGSWKEGRCSFKRPRERRQLMQNKLRAYNLSMMWKLFTKIIS